MRRKKKGMTLIEVIAAIAIFMIVAVAVTSTIAFTIRANDSNVAKLDANTNSKSFIEYFKQKANRPERYEVGPPEKGLSPGVYDMAFKDEAEIKIFIDTLLRRTSATIPTVVKRVTVPSNVTFDNALASIGTNKRAGDKYILTAKINWDNTNLVYVIDIWSWEIDKRSTSEINRRVLIGPK